MTLGLMIMRCTRLCKVARISWGRERCDCLFDLEELSCDETDIGCLRLTLSPSTCSLQSGESSSHTHLHLQTYQIIMFLHVFYQLHAPYNTVFLKKLLFHKVDFCL